MRTGMCGRGQIFYVGLLQAFGRQSGRSNRHIEDFCDRSADSSFIRNSIAIHHIVGNDSSLTVGRDGKIVQPRLSGDRMFVLYGITYGVDILIRSLQVLVDSYSPGFPDSQSGFSCQLRFRSYSD